MKYKALYVQIFLIFFYLADIVLSQEILLKVAPQSSSLFKSSIGQNKTGVAKIDAVLGLNRVQETRAVFSNEYTFSDTPLNGWIKCTFQSRDDAQSALDDLQQMEEILSANHNRVFSLYYTPNDSRVTEQWALQKIDAFTAWDTERGSSDVLIAVIDTGIDYNHPDLMENVWINPGEDVNHNGITDISDMNGIDDDGNGFVDDIVGWDFTDAPNYPDAGDYSERDNDPMDEMGHGTGVAGIISAVTDNNTGIAGAAPGCRVMALRAFTSGGNGEEDDVASAILYAIENGAGVINMSWGDVFVTRIIEDVVRYAASKGVVLVASSGNSSTDEIHYPSAFPETISVGATDKDDAIAGYSNYGASVDMVAPGSDILTTDIDNSYSTMNGTSFAAPFVSAAAGLLLSQNPEQVPESIKGILVSTADDLGEKGTDSYYRAGRLNMTALLAAASGIVVRINNPVLDQGIAGNSIDIYGSAWGPVMESYTLSFGTGPNPDVWTMIESVSDTRVLDGFLGSWNDIPQEEGEYTIRLLVKNRDDTEVESSTRVFIDKTAPVISSVNLVPMLDADLHSVLVQFSTDDLCEGSLFYRPLGSSAPFHEAATAYRTRELRYHLSQSEISEKVEIYVKAVNGAGLESIDDNNGNYYIADLDKDPTSVTNYTPVNLILPFGHLLNQTFDFNQNGLPELIISADDQGSIGTIQFWEFDGQDMIKVAEIETDLIPRDMADITGDGIPELLCGFGFSSYIYTITKSGGFPTQLYKTFTGTSSEQYWASGFADMDQDGNAEIIVRVVDTDSDQYEVWEQTNSDFSPVAALENPTYGENIYGVPHVETGDFDNDGLIDMLFGDNDGDLFIYENTGNNNFKNTWQDSLPLMDSIDFLRAGDFDGDGETEFIAGCHSDPNLNTEHYYDARHWYYSIYDHIGNDKYERVAEWRFFGFESVRDYPAGVSAGDLDDDGDDEIFISIFPDLYLIDFIEGQYVVDYHYQTALGNSCIITDGDGDGMKEFFVGTGEYTRSFNSTGEFTGLAIPVGVSAHPVDKNEVQLTWREVSDASQYLVYRSTNPLYLVPYKTVTENNLLDVQVATDTLYWYAVKSVSAIDPQNTSGLSVMVSARPGEKPFLQTANAETDRNIRLYFNEPMSESSKSVSNYHLGDLGRPVSAVMGASGRQVLLSWSGPLPEGEHTIYCANLTDAERTPMDSLRSSAIISVEYSLAAPYLVNGKLKGNNELLLTFSIPMGPSVENPENYDMGKEINVVSAVRIDDQNVLLELETESAFGALGKNYIIRVLNVSSANGVSIEPGRGDMLTLIFARNDLSNVITFPNPYRPGLGVDGITFGNLTKTAEIRIMTDSGLHIRTLSEQNGDGGVEWDLLDNNGNFVSSGIYIYRITNDKQNVLGKLAIIR